MSPASAPSTYGARDPSNWVKGIVVVVALHVLIGYALVSGMARKGLDLVKKPLEAVLIQEVVIPPPLPPTPPPPPQKVEPPKELPKVQAPPPFVPPPDVAPPVVSTAQVIAASPTPPPAPVVITPPPPPAPPAPAPAAAAPAPVAVGPKRASIGVACPTQVEPLMPDKAYRLNAEGVVKAQFLVKDGSVQVTTITLSGPTVFYDSVRTALKQYKCLVDGSEVLTSQEFTFKWRD